MASLWEIFEVSTLSYDTENGVTFDDSGSGPPSIFSGWVRTGRNSDNLSSTVGVPNCNSRTTNTGNGTRVGLASNWGGFIGTSGDVSPWIANLGNCAFPLPVWCVQD
jgi:hypothetical protein